MKRKVTDPKIKTLCRTSADILPQHANDVDKGNTASGLSETQQAHRSYSSNLQKGRMQRRFMSA